MRFGFGHDSPVQIVQLISQIWQLDICQNTLLHFEVSFGAKQFLHFGFEFL